MKTRLEEIDELLADVNCDIDSLILRNGDRDEIREAIERRTELLIEKHDILARNPRQAKTRNRA